MGRISRSSAAAEHADEDDQHYEDDQMQVDEEQDPEEEAEDEDEDEDDDENRTYDVEKILSHRRDRKTGKDEFRIKWAGYPSTQNTWEPIENITSKQLLEDYWAEVAKKGKGDKAKSPVRKGRASAAATPATGRSSRSTRSAAVESEEEQEDEEEEHEEAPAKRRGRPAKSASNGRVGRATNTRKRDDEDDEHDERAPRKRQLRTRDVTPPISHDVEDGEEIDDDDDEPRPLKLRSSRTTAASSGSPAAKRKAVPRKPTQSIFNAMPDAPDIDNDETDGDDPHVTKEGFIAESRMDPKLMAKRSWEDDIDHVDTIERAGIGLCVYLVWKSGLKSVHPTPTANKKCPQKLLAFYESHLKFTPPANPSSSSSPSNGGDQLETHGALALTQPPNSDPEAEENDTTITTTETTTTHFRVATISTNNTLPPSPSGDIRRLFDELAEADAGLSTASRNHNEDEEEEEGLPEGYETQRGRGAGIYGHLF